MQKAGYNIQNMNIMKMYHCEIISCTFDGTTATFSEKQTKIHFDMVCISSILSCTKEQHLS